MADGLFLGSDCRCSRQYARQKPEDIGQPSNARFDVCRFCLYVSGVLAAGKGEPEVSRGCLFGTAFDRHDSRLSWCQSGYFEESRRGSGQRHPSACGLVCRCICTVHRRMLAANDRLRRDIDGCGRCACPKVACAARMDDGDSHRPDRHVFAHASPAARCVDSVFYQRRQHPAADRDAV